MGAGKRIANKLAAGALGGLVGGFLGVGSGVFLGTLGTEDCEGGDDLCGIGAGVVGLFGGVVGYTVGTAVGVTLADPHDRFIMALGGSLLGFFVGGIMGPNDRIDTLQKAWAPFVGSTIVGVCASEGTRKPPKASRFSFGLSPSPGTGISAVANLRF